jgi:hypothetical protein
MRLISCLASYIAAALSMPLFSAGPVAPSPRSPGTYVRFEDLGRCPRLARRERPTSARDV